MPVRILIAEDSPSVRTALRALLEGAGPWEVIDVEDGQEAIAKAQELKPNLIILNLVMPVTDGLSAARQISKLLPEIPIMMHTMHGSPQLELEARKVGVRHVVSKADTSLLVSTVQQLLTSQPPSPLNAELVAPPSDVPAPPNLVPSPPILESGSVTNPDKPEAPAVGGAADVPGNVPGNHRPN